MKRKPRDIEARAESMERRCAACGDFGEELIVHDLIAEVCRLRRRPRVSKRLVRMARDWVNENRLDLWCKKHGKKHQGTTSDIFALAILAEARKDER